jgi:hypothetical protein
MKTVIRIPITDEFKCVVCKKKYEFQLSDYIFDFMHNNIFICWKCIGISRKKFNWFLQKKYPQIKSLIK